ncbi:MAG: hypothetical protein RLZZ69_1499, partial [Cyanobacteriota bacterium]
MVANLEIQSVLSLDTQQASKKLQDVLTNTKPPVHALDFDTTKVSKKLSEINQSASNVQLNPLIDTRGIDSLIAQLTSIKTSAIAVSTIVDNSDVNQLIGQFEKLRSQSELKLKLSSEAQDVTIGNQGSRYGAEIAAIAREQSKLTKESIREQKNTQSTIKQTSAVSFGNITKQAIARSVGSAVKSSVFSTFNLDDRGLEKALGKILPSTKILGADLQDMAAKFDKATGSSVRLKKLANDLVSGLAEDTANSKSFEEIGDKFKKTAKSSFDEFRSEVVKTRSEMSSLGAVLKAIGIDTDSLEYSLLTTKTGGSIARGLSLFFI